MEPQNVQTTLKQALHIIGKMSGWLGIDIDELNADYNNVYDNIVEAIESLEGEK